MSHEVDVVVLGAGPAGVAAAVGLRKLGHSVMLFGASRNTSIEGLSRRAHALLTRLDLDAAARCARGPGKRSGTWAGAPVAMHGEYVVDRAEFDRALARDAASHAVVSRHELVTKVERDGELWRVRTRDGAVRSCAVVDARGRRTGRALHKGPSLLALSQPLRGIAADCPQTAIFPVESGWCWLASVGNGTGSFQWVTSSPGLSASRRDLARLVLLRMPEVLGRVWGCDRAVPVGLPEARAATARMLPSACQRGYVRAGDAAVACDPLSGHGLYEALRSASIAVVGIHTFLVRDSWGAIARFMQESSQELWDTAVGAAAAFYRHQSVCTAAPFWSQTAQAYESLRSGQPPRDGSRVESRPVLNGALIEMRDVVVTAERPRGVWQVDEVELAGLLDFFHNEPLADIEHAACRLERRPAAIANAARWLITHGLLRGCNL
jgi:menaquinone-9 beta-reductase